MGKKGVSEFCCLNLLYFLGDFLFTSVKSESKKADIFTMFLFGRFWTNSHQSAARHGSWNRFAVSNGVNVKGVVVWYQQFSSRASTATACSNSMLGYSSKLQSNSETGFPGSLTREEGFVEPLFKQPRKKLPLVLPEFTPMEYPLFACLFISSIGHTVRPSFKTNYSLPKASQLLTTMLNSSSHMTLNDSCRSRH